MPEHSHRWGQPTEYTAGWARECACGSMWWEGRPAPADPSLDRRARDAYDVDMRQRAEAHIPWSDLAEWQRESWRCDVDEDRDLDLVRWTKGYQPPRES